MRIADCGNAGFASVGFCCSGHSEFRTLLYEMQKETRQSAFVVAGLNMCVIVSCGCNAGVCGLRQK